MIYCQKNISKKIKLVIILTLCVLFINISSFFNRNANNEVFNEQIKLQTIYISEDTIWNIIGSPYVINETIVIEQFATLTIEPGVQVLFNKSTSLIIDGILNATGTSTNPIIFTSNSSTPTKGDWESIYFRQSSLESFSIIKYANISYADKGIRIDNSVVQIINNNIYSNTNGIYLEQLPNNGDIIIKNNILFNHSENGIYMWGDTLGNVNVSVINNKIYSNGYSGVWPSLYFGAYICIGGDYLRLNFQNNEIFNNYFDGINFNWGEDLYSFIFRNNSVYMNNGKGVILHYIYPHQFLDFQYNEIYNNLNSGVAMDHLGRGDRWIKNFFFQYNKIYNNKNDGIISSTNSIENFYFRFNEIFNNTNNGISITGASYSIKSLFLQNNEIYNNTNGLYIDYWNELNFDMSKNNIFNNSIYAIECRWANPSNYVIVRRNWWGTNETSEINDMVFDYYDDTNYAKVDFLPILTNPVSETYNAIAPQFNNLQINDTAILVGDHVNISIEVTDNVKIDSVWIYIDNYNYKMTNINDTDTFCYIFIPYVYNLTCNFIISSNDTSGIINTFNGYLTMESTNDDDNVDDDDDDDDDDNVDDDDNNNNIDNNLFLIIPIIIGIAITGIFGMLFIRSYFKKERRRIKQIPIPQSEELQIKTEEIKEEYKNIEIKKGEMLSSQEFLCKNCGNLIQITDYLKSRKKIFCEKCGVLITLPEK